MAVDAFGRRRGLELDLSTIIILVVLTLVLFQAMGLMFGSALGFDVKLGPVFVLLPLAISTVLAAVMTKKLVKNQEITKQDTFALVVIFIIALLVLFFLRDFVPEIFEQSIVQLQSMIGM